MKPITLLITSDLHSGHFAGLTPKKWWSHTDMSWRNQQERMWDFYRTCIGKIGRIDTHINNGDAIEGKGERSGGTELIQSDRTEQAEMATEALRASKARRYILTYGTPYHVGREDDFERIIATNLKGEIHGHLFADIGGKIFDFKHKVGSSNVPYGRHTAVARSKTWNTIWASLNGQPHSDILVRSHVHYFDYNGNKSHLMFTTPCLQGFGSKFGVRQCEGIIDIGVVWMKIYKDKVEWGAMIMDYETIKQKNGVFDMRLK